MTGHTGLNAARSVTLGSDVLHFTIRVGRGGNRSVVSRVPEEGSLSPRTDEVKIMMMVKNSVLLLVAIALLACTATAGSRWTPEQAQAWSKKVGWLVGCNFTPSTAINQLEMWQADTFDPATIDRELGWAEGIGMNSVRVFLHHIAWEQDPSGFLDRMDKFLELAHKHKIGVMFVFFDGCWDPMPRPGKQRSPRPHVHNSGWLQDPGREILSHPAQLDKLEPYVAAVFGRFAQDDRIHAWDLFNERKTRIESAMAIKDRSLSCPTRPHACSLFWKRSLPGLARPNLRSRSQWAFGRAAGTSPSVGLQSSVYAWNSPTSSASTATVHSTT